MFPEAYPPFLVQPPETTKNAPLWPSVHAPLVAYQRVESTIANEASGPAFPFSLQHGEINQGINLHDYATPSDEELPSLRENHHAQATGPPDVGDFQPDDSGMQLKMQSLSMLENLAVQLIHSLAKASFPRIQDFVQGSDSEESQAFATLKGLFDQTRKVYSRGAPFIDAIAIQLFQPAQQEIIRKANAATFIFSILGAYDISFFHLNEFFLETFVPSGHRLLKWQGALFLELKTQTYISALINSDGPPDAILSEIFPYDVDAQVLARHPDTPGLSPSEQDFIERGHARKNYLMLEDSSDGAMNLQKKYQWQDFVREFSSSVTKNIESVVNLAARPALNLAVPGSERCGSLIAQKIEDGEFTANGIAMTTNQVLDTLSRRDSIAPVDRKDPVRKQTHATASIRQPWTKTEEDALLDGLERVGGAHWSLILALHGRGGSISEVLKDRSQVQLKDKARNLKLFYLKASKPVPRALQGVTGELRKRIGARARSNLRIVESGERSTAWDEATEDRVEAQ